MEREIIDSNQEFNEKLSTTADGQFTNAIFDNCEFSIPIFLTDEMNIINFGNCVFNENVSIRTKIKGDAYFQDCVFEKDLDLTNSTFNGNTRFQECHFKGETTFNNVIFNNLADFWRSKFENIIIFYKTDFMGTAVFSASIFKNNVLFTYSLINKLLLFRGTKIDEGLDLSLAIISGELGVFDLKLKDFKSITNILDEQLYENNVSKFGKIPIKNKRETFRILKKYHESQNNIVESLPFKVLEKKTLFKESIHNLIRWKNKNETNWKYIINIKDSIFNLFVLFLNCCSNYFGIAYFQSVIFTLIIGALFFYLSIMHTSKYELSCSIDWNIIKENIPAYTNFLIPTHKFDYLGDNFLNKFEINNWFYFFDILGSMFISYGFYQTIQAFRKFR